MRSPFEIFRQHQKMLTVVLTGLAMFAFVILGAVPDPSNMPPLLGAIFIGGVVGGLAWLAGIRQKKSNEWGTVGFVAGLAIGLAAMLAVGPGDVVLADSGNINQLQMSTLYRQRAVANQFVNMAFYRAQENGMQAFSGGFAFGFGHPVEERDIVVGELLRREADRLGIQVTDESVNDFIRSEFQGKIGAAEVREIRSSLGISESALYECLSSELKAFHAGRFLYGGITVPNGRNPLPPVEYWDFYRKMNIQDSVGIVPIPVAAFIDNSANPTDAELQQLFAEHKGNYPNTTAEGRLEEGLIGFRQPRRVALEYIEIPYEAVEETIPEVTDEEIEAHYEEFYKSAPDMPMPEGEGDASIDGPVLPELTAEDESDTDDKRDMKSPDAAPESNPDTPKAPASETPAEKPEQTPASEEAKPETSADDAEAPADASRLQTPKPETSKEESEPADEEVPSSEESPQKDSGASLRSPTGLQMVAFFDDTPPAEDKTSQDPPTEDDKPASEDSSDQPPAEKTDENPAETPPKDAATPGEEQPKTDDAKSDAKKPIDEKAPADGDAPAADDENNSTATAPAAGAPADPPKPRELDDELRAEIRDQILRRKTADRQQELMSQTFELMGLELALGATTPADDPLHVPAETTTQKLKEYAAANGLVYERTPLLSLRELEQSEEYPIGHATSATNVQSTASAARMALNAAPTDLYHAEQVLDIESGSRFVFWKIDDVPAYEPQSLDDPGIREQVVQAWRELQAREKARKRADDLARQANEIDKPLSEVFAGETVTGSDSGAAISVLHPPRFSWLSAANAQMSPNPFNRPAPTLTELRTVPGDVGDQFMQTVFNELQPDEAGVTHSFDLEYYYVVKVDDRTYGTSPDLQAFRERFTTQPVFDRFGFSDYYKLATRELAQYQTNWAEELFKRHKVTFAEPDPDQES